MSVIGLLTFTNLNNVMAQDAPNNDTVQTEQVTDDSAAVADEAVAEPVEATTDEAEEAKSFHEVLK